MKTTLKIAGTLDRSDQQYLRKIGGQLDWRTKTVTFAREIGNDEIRLHRMIAAGTLARTQEAQ